jgi:hypothetical protein
LFCALFFLLHDVFFSVQPIAMRELGFVEKCSISGGTKEQGSAQEKKTCESSASFPLTLEKRLMVSVEANS